MPTCNNPIHLLPNIVVIWLPLLRESNLLCYTLSVFIELSIKNWKKDYIGIAVTVIV